MFKKILFLLLLAVLGALSLALYNQYSLLPGSKAPEVDATAENMEAIRRTWAPPQAKAPEPPPQPQPESSFQDLALWERGKGELPLKKQQEPQQQKASQQDPQQQQHVQQESQQQHEQQEPQKQQAAPSPQTDSADTQPSAPSSDEAGTSPQADQDSAQPDVMDEKPQDHSAEASKAEKALRRGEGWLEGQARDAEGLAQGVERELQHEKQVVDEMHITKEQEASPEAQVDHLVQDIEKRSLGEPQQPKYKPEEPKEPPMPKPDPADAKGPNQLLALRLSSDGEAVMLRVSTTQPVEKYTAFQMRNPKRFVLDLHGTFKRNVRRVDVLPNAMVKDLRIGLHTRMLRIVADLHDDVAVETSMKNPEPNELQVVMRHKN